MKKTFAPGHIGQRTRLVTGAFLIVLAATALIGFSVPGGERSEVARPVQDCATAEINEAIYDIARGKPFTLSERCRAEMAREGR